MVDSRAKGAEGEKQVKELLRKHTGLPFERVPMSGALPFMKGDLFVPDTALNYCIEVKFYKNSHFDDKVISNKSNEFVRWWEQAVNQGKKTDRKPVLFFKYNRSKIFVAVRDEPKNTKRYMYVGHLDCYVMLADEWLINEKPRFINGENVPKLESARSR
jgi:Holliday junction resolvase|tara:strand:+ start:5054 stop:5530 length:477 start_codon:yes stop_codon:yes gene_type:complete